MEGNFPPEFEQPTLYLPLFHPTVVNPANFSEKACDSGLWFDCPSLGGEREKWRLAGTKTEAIAWQTSDFSYRTEREKREWKLMAQTSAIYWKTKWSLDKAKIAIWYWGVPSLYLRPILSDFSNKYNLRTILCLWKTVLKLHPSVVILLHLPGSANND